MKSVYIFKDENGEQEIFSNFDKAYNEVLRYIKEDLESSPADFNYYKGRVNNTPIYETINRSGCKSHLRKNSWIVQISKKDSYYCDLMIEHYRVR